MPKSSDEAALEAARNLLGLDDDVEGETEETPDPSSDTGTEEPETEEEVEDEGPELPSFDIHLPDDLLEELELEDLQETETEDSEEEFPDADPELIARLKKAEKEAQYHRDQRLKEGKKGWVAEAKEHFPLSEPFLGEIKAESRRSFLRQARDIHVKMTPLVEERVLKPARAAIEEEKSRARAEARAAAEKAWGKVPGSMGAPADAAATQEKVETARRKGDLAGTIRAMMGGD